MEKDAEIINDDASSTGHWPHQEIEKVLQKNVELTQQNNVLQQKLSEFEISLELALAKVQWFEEQFKLHRHQQFGKSSESSSALQMPLLFNADEGKPTEEETTPETPTNDTITYIVPRRKKVGRKLDTTSLPRQQVTHDLAEKICQSCEGELHKGAVMYSVTRLIVLIPELTSEVTVICLVP